MTTDDSNREAAGALREAYRPQFLVGLTLIETASERLHQQGHGRPILVGGAAVELYSGGSIATGDFDLVTPAQEAFEAILLDMGFVRTGLQRGVWHPVVQMGVEVVSGRLFDQRADVSRLRRFGGSGGSVVVPAIEDMIADRMGQHSADHTETEMFDQAVLLFHLAENVNREYLDRRIREETADDFTLSDLEDDH